MTRSSAGGGPVRLRPPCLACLVPLVLAGSALGAWAQSPTDPRAAQPERPTVATHAFTVAPGVFELETAVQGLRPSAGVTQVDAPSLVKIGLTSRLQFDVFAGLTSFDGARSPSGSGFTDTAVGLKWRVADAMPVAGALALQGTVKLPTGSISKGTGTGTTDLTLLAISSHVVGEVAVDVNVGVTRRSGDGAVVPTTATMWAASAGFPVVGRMGWAVELFGYPGTRGPAGARPVVAVLTGPTLELHRSVVVDGGIVAGLAGEQPATWYLGLTWNMGRAWR